MFLQNNVSSVDRNFMLQMYRANEVSDKKAWKKVKYWLLNGKNRDKPRLFKFCRVPALKKGVVMSQLAGRSDAATEEMIMQYLTAIIYIRFISVHANFMVEINLNMVEIKS